MRILQLCPRFPFPLIDGGRIGIFNITQALAAQGHEITMLTFDAADTDAAAIAGVERVAHVHVVHDDTRTNLRNFLRGILRREPVYMARHRSGNFLRALDTRLASAQYDAVYGDHTAMAPYLLYVRAKAGIPAGMRLHNIESVIWQRYARESREPVRRLVVAHQARMLKRIEAAAIRKMDVNFAITNVDRDRALLMAPGADVRVVFPGVDTGYWQPIAASHSSPCAATVTMLVWVHNVDGILWFLDHVAPRIRDRVPDFQLHVVGKGAPRRLRNRIGSGLVLHGFLDDVRPVMAQSPVYVVPLHVGGGIRIKIIEAMAMGRPVVTTSIGGEGIPATSGTHWMVADTPDAFAAAVADLIADPARARAMGNAALDIGAALAEARERMKGTG
jgi:glycosyltransferase involved in cell wall biosynthesis